MTLALVVVVALIGLVAWDYLDHLAHRLHTFANELHAYTHTERTKP